MPTVRRRQLWQCLNAKVNRGVIYCAKGVRLTSLSPSVSLELARKGDPLVLTKCQGCLYYDEMGKPLTPSERGWHCIPQLA